MKILTNEVKTVFAVVPNLSRLQAEEVTRNVCNELVNLRADFAMCEEHREIFSDVCSTYLNEDDLYRVSDVIIAIGGDGTIISCAKKASAFSKPILGINAGRVAFMAGLESQELELLDRLISGDYTVDKRMMLSASIVLDGKVTEEINCVNDVFVGRSQNVNMVKLNVKCDGATVSNYYSDGIILSTPTGSTAYSLSAGGPVVDPLIESILLTPVCPHSLFQRPMIFRSECVLEIENETAPGTAFVFFDGGEGYPISENCKVLVRKSEKTADFIRIKSDTFVDILNTKLRSN